MCRELSGHGLYVDITVGIVDYGLVQKTQQREARYHKDMKQRLPGNSNPLLLQVTSQVGNELELLADIQSADNGLQNRADGDMALANQASVVYVGEDPH